MLRDGIPCCELFEIEMGHNHCCQFLRESASHCSGMPLLCVPDEGTNYLFLTFSNTQQNIIYYCPWCAIELLPNLNENDEVLDSANAQSITSLTDFCCNQLKKGLHDNQIPLNYDAKMREYYIGRGVVSVISYCPWCAFKFPKDLRDEWFNILENEYKIDDPFGGDRRRIPKAFRSDEWWKKRGL